MKHLSLIRHSGCLATCLLAGFFLAACASAEEDQGHARYGNPPDLDRYIRMLMDPHRDAWQQPERVVRALGLKPGDTACDIGAGPGYFTLRLARAVGTSGHVYAVDVEPRILGKLRDNLGEAGVRNVTPVLALADDPLLPGGACDVALIVDTYHHFPDGPDYLHRLEQALRPGGRIVNIDFREDADFGPRHRIPRGIFMEQARQAGLVMVEEKDFLEQQYFIFLEPSP